eukprot:scaffold36903_cov66-Phaeocystis_antarctica.AAC.4
MGEGGKGYISDVVGAGGPRVLASCELRACLAYSCKRDRYSNDNNHYYKNNGPIRSVLLEPLAKRYGLALAAI